jgi:hypothetical protein
MVQLLKYEALISSMSATLRRAADAGNLSISDRDRCYGCLRAAGYSADEVRTWVEDAMRWEQMRREAFGGGHAETKSL